MSSAEPDVPAALPPGVLGFERAQYRGKHYTLPIFDPAAPIVLRPAPDRATYDRDPQQPVLRAIDRTWDLAEFSIPRRPVSLGVLTADELAQIDQHAVEAGINLWKTSSDK